MDNRGVAVRLGELKRYVPIDFERYTCPWRQAVARDLNPLYTPTVNKVDLGIITVDDADTARKILCIGPLRGKRVAREGELLMKTGRTTGYTTDGPVRDLNYYGRVEYSRGRAQFGPVGLVKKQDFTLGGDSSSAFISQNNRHFVGLGFAGSTSHSIFCHTNHIESEGNVRIYI